METIEYKGFDININQDENPLNPWEDWGTCMPLITYHDGHIHDYSDGRIYNYLSDYFTSNQIVRHLSKIISYCDYYVSSVSEFNDLYPLSLHTVDERCNIIRGWLQESFEGSLDNMAYFCELFKIKYYHTTLWGYSQGDKIDVFFCYTPQFGKITGATYESITNQDFVNSSKLFEQYAFGDVYWYKIEDENETLIDSCGGYYGDDFEDSGLLETARGAIDMYLEAERKNKLSRLKTMIKHNVPLYAR